MLNNGTAKVTIQFVFDFASSILLKSMEKETGKGRKRERASEKNDVKHCMG